VILVQMF